MSHGTPDFGATSGQATSYQLTDLAELAVRLGSIVSFDRRGDVVYLEDFENGLGSWTAVAFGAGSAAGLTRVHRRSGGFGALLEAGAPAGAFAQISREIPLPAVSKVGVAAFMSWDSDAGSIDLFVEVCRGDRLFSGAVRYDVSADTIAILNSAGGYTTIASAVYLAQYIDTFTALKLVIDVETGKYVRAIVNDTSYDLRSYNCYQTGATLYAYVLPTLRLNGRTGWTPAAAVDSVIVTQNEP